MPNGTVDVVPNAGVAVDEGPPNIDEVPPNRLPVVVGAGVDPPKFPNLGASGFFSPPPPAPPNVNFGASDEKTGRFAGTPSVVVVPTSPEN